MNRCPNCVSLIRVAIATNSIVLGNTPAGGAREGLSDARRLHRSMVDCDATAGPRHAWILASPAMAAAPH
jgi:hypothetical protein